MTLFIRPHIEELHSRNNRSLVEEIIGMPWLTKLTVLLTLTALMDCHLPANLYTHIHKCVHVYESTFYKICLVVFSDKSAYTHADKVLSIAKWREKGCE